MFTCEYKRNGLNILEVHYCNNIKELHSKVKGKYDLLKCYQADSHLKNLEKFHTLHIDLEQDIDDIIKGFAKNTRNEINRCHRDDDIKLIINDQVTDADIVEFIVLFSEFNKLKNLNANVNELQASLLRNKENVVLLKATKDNKVIVFNVYYFDEVRARLKCSVSIRGDDSQERNLIGRSNRTLCLEAIRFFKEKNVKFLIWVGYRLQMIKIRKILIHLNLNLAGSLSLNMKGIIQ